MEGVVLADALVTGTKRYISRSLNNIGKIFGI